MQPRPANAIITRPQDTPRRETMREVGRHVVLVPGRSAGRGPRPSPPSPRQIRAASNSAGSASIASGGTPSKRSVRRRGPQLPLRRAPSMILTHPCAAASPPGVGASREVLACAVISPVVFQRDGRHREFEGRRRRHRAAFRFRRGPEHALGGPGGSRPPRKPRAARDPSDGGDAHAGAVVNLER